MMYDHNQCTTDSDWKRRVLCRDDYTCQVPNCGAQTNLDAHHIESRRRNPKLRRLVSNGVTLCRAHHNYFHDFPGEWLRFRAILEVNRQRGFYYTGSSEPRQNQMESRVCLGVF